MKLIWNEGPVLGGENDSWRTRQWLDNVVRYRNDSKDELKKEDNVKKMN